MTGSLLLLLLACSPDSPGDTAAHSGVDLLPTQGDPHAERVVSFTPGDAAGFGSDAMPGVVLGPPLGRGESAGSLDVLSLGRRSSYPRWGRSRPVGVREPLRRLCRAW